MCDTVKVTIEIDVNPELWRCEALPNPYNLESLQKHISVLSQSIVTCAERMRLATGMLPPNILVYGTEGVCLDGDQVRTIDVKELTGGGA
jgi:hypothetical protein